MLMYLSTFILKKCKRNEYRRFILRIESCIESLFISFTHILYQNIQNMSTFILYFLVDRHCMNKNDAERHFYLISLCNSTM